MVNSEVKLGGFFYFHVQHFKLLERIDVSDLSENVKGDTEMYATVTPDQPQCKAL